MELFYLKNHVLSVLLTFILIKDFCFLCNFPKLLPINNFNNYLPEQAMYSFHCVNEGVVVYLLANGNSSNIFQTCVTRSAIGQ